jgi:hypothetical protein
MRWQAKVASILLSIIAVVTVGQSPWDVRSSAQDEQARGSWVAHSTELMWAGKDNGRDVSWKKAVKYCRNLRLAGYSDWRLATLAELGAIFDRNANAPGLAGSGKDNLFTYHVKGNLFLTGDQWSSNYRTDDRGHNSGYERYFDFNEGRADNQPSGFPNPSASMRALCARFWRIIECRDASVDQVRPSGP